MDTTLKDSMSHIAIGTSVLGHRPTCIK